VFLSVVDGTRVSIRFEYLNAFFGEELFALVYLYTASFFVSERPVGDLTAWYLLPSLKPLLLYSTVLPRASITLIFSTDGFILGAKPLEPMVLSLIRDLFNATFPMFDACNWFFLMITVALE